MEKLFSANSIVGVTIPYDGFEDVASVGSVEVVRPAAVQRLIRRTITGAPASTKHCSPRPKGHSTKSGTKARAPIDSKCID
jgi:hypothetical protein